MHRQNNFDFLRIVAALCVLYSHQHALSGLPEPAVLNVASLGGFGVMIFFSISGFLVSRSWDSDPNVFRFAIRRLLRVWPGFAVAVILCALVLGPLVSDFDFHSYFSSPFLRDYFQNLIFNLRDQLPLRFEGNKLPTAINGSLWTIPLELKCYMVLMVMGIAGVLRNRWILLVLTLIILCAYALIEPRGDRLASFFKWSVERKYLVEFGLFFFTGALLYFFKLPGVGVPRYRLLVLFWALAIVAWMAHRPVLALLFSVPITSIAIGTASTPGLRKVGRFGDLSYGLYIYAFPIQQTMIWGMHNLLPWNIVLLLTVIVTFGMAFLSWHMIEKRALRLKPSARKQNGRLQQDQNNETAELQVQL